MPAAPPNASPRPTVLVVDDGPTNRLLLHAYLDRDYRVLDAPDGPTALAIVEREPVDLVLLDVMMPGLSGLDVCRRIKASPRGELLPVILVTALGDQESRNEGLEAGADDFVAKPPDRRELILRIELFLRLREQERTIRRQVEDLRRLQGLKDDLLSLIVHDLRNPLSGAAGYLQIMERIVGEPSEVGSLRECIGGALDAVKKLKDLIEGTLEIRLIEEGGLPVRRAPSSLRAIVVDAAATVAGAARAREVRIDLAAAAAAAPDAPVSIDPKLVRRAVENLLANAVRYSPPGEAVDVAIRADEAGAAIEIADRGPGIPDAVKSSIFEKNGSVEAWRGEARRGHGLGLYFVRLVATAHGGDAAVADRPGGGSLFRLRLAVAK